MSKPYSYLEPTLSPHTRWFLNTLTAHSSLLPCLVWSLEIPRFPSSIDSATVVQTSPPDDLVCHLSKRFGNGTMLFLLHETSHWYYIKLWGYCGHTKRSTKLNSARKVSRRREQQWCPKSCSGWSALLWAITWRMNSCSQWFWRLLVMNSFWTHSYLGFRR